MSNEIVGDYLKYIYDKSVLTINQSTSFVHELQVCLVIEIIYFSY